MSDEARPTNTAPLSPSGCLEDAARMLRFAEGETDSRLFEHWTSLAEHWIELSAQVRENATV